MSLRLHPTRLGFVAGTLLLGLLANGASAQSPLTADSTVSRTYRIPGPQPVSPALLGLEPVAGMPGPASGDTLPCPQCDPPRRFWLGFADLMLVQLLPMVFDVVILDAPYAKISTTTWRNNLAYPWVWDHDIFVTNQFGHPLHGSMYYNAGRSNGYNFWGSALWPVAGSLMWELFAEVEAPAYNDFVNTSVGGIILGEALYRLSRLPLDNTATGSGRVWREIGSAVLNPVSGFNRLVRGETHTISANPPEWHPSAILGVLDVGYRRSVRVIATDEFETGHDQWNASFLLSYGDPVKDLARAPFSYFSVRADIAGPGDEGVLNQLSARGSLASWPLNANRHHQIAVMLEYDYFNNPAFVYGGQSVQVGLISSIGAPGKTWWGQTGILFNGVILGATQSDYRTSEGRLYDYGPGWGPIVGGRMIYKNKVQATLGYTGLWLFTIDGTESSHYQDALLLEGRFWATRTLGIGLGYVGYARHSDYAGRPDVAESATFWRAFVTTAIPGLPR